MIPYSRSTRALEPDPQLAALLLAYAKVIGQMRPEPQRSFQWDPTAALDLERAENGVRNGEM